MATINGLTAEYTLDRFAEIELQLGLITDVELPTLNGNLSQYVADQVAADAAAMNFIHTKNSVFRQDEPPTGTVEFPLRENDIWFDTNDDMRVYIYKNFVWLDSRDGLIATKITEIQAQAIAQAEAQLAADGKSFNFYKTYTPTNEANNIGDNWFVRPDTTGPITAQYEGLGGVAWIQRAISGLVLTNLDAGTITAGFLSAARVSVTFLDGKIMTGGIVQTDVRNYYGIKFTNAGLLAYNNGITSPVFSLDASTGSVIMKGTLSVGSVINGAQLVGSDGIYTSTNPLVGIKMNNNGLTAFDGVKATFNIVALTGEVSMLGSILAGSTITGASFQTGITGERLVINTVGTKNEILFYTGGLSEIAPGSIKSLYAYNATVGKYRSYLRFESPNVSSGSNQAKLDLYSSHTSASDSEVQLSAYYVRIAASTQVVLDATTIWIDGQLKVLNGGELNGTFSGATVFSGGTTFQGGIVVNSGGLTVGGTTQLNALTGSTGNAFVMVGNSGVISRGQPYSQGAADSGGTGYRVLRVPN